MLICCVPKGCARGIALRLMLVGSYIGEASLGNGIVVCVILGQRERAVSVGKGCDRAKHVWHGCTPCWAITRRVGKCRDKSISRSESYGWCRSLVAQAVHEVLQCNNMYKRRLIFYQTGTQSFVLHSTRVPGIIPSQLGIVSLKPNLD